MDFIWDRPSRQVFGIAHGADTGTQIVLKDMFAWYCDFMKADTFKSKWVYKVWVCINNLFIVSVELMRMI